MTPTRALDLATFLLLAALIWTFCWTAWETKTLRPVGAAIVLAALALLFALVHLAD